MKEAGARVMSASIEGSPPPWVTDWLSEARLAPYVRAVGPEGALELYRWNCRVSSALFELIGWFEIAWRNAVDRVITRNRSPGAPHWLFDSGFPLRPGSKAKVTRALDTLRRGGVTAPAPGQVIAELSLGFWRFTMRGYATTLWAPHLSKAFPHAPHRPRREDVDHRLHEIILCRNRIAHHEPVFARPDELRKRVDDVVMLGSWINPRAAAWWNLHTTVHHVLDEQDDQGPGAAGRR